MNKIVCFLLPLCGLFSFLSCSNNILLEEPPFSEKITTKAGSNNEVATVIAEVVDDSTIRYELMIDKEYLNSVTFLNTNIQIYFELRYYDNYVTPAPFEYGEFSFSLYDIPHPTNQNWTKTGFIYTDTKRFSQRGGMATLKHIFPNGFIKSDDLRLLE